MKLNRVMIAAPHSGSGKTAITCAFLQILKDRGVETASCKCGPDYIDPMFHKEVLGVPSRNLDTYFSGEEMTRRLLVRDRREGDTVVIEGVMGLFDGIGGVSEEGSSYHLAKVTKTPIILVIDAKGMGRSLLPLIAGFLSYDREHLIKGVILNRISPAFCERIKPVIEEELKVKVIGCMPELKDVVVGSRHLGLMMPEEIADIRDRIRKMATELEKSVSVEDILNIAESAEPVTGFKEDEIIHTEEERPLIAVAKDEAFCFHYEDNLKLLTDCGARLTYFSPIHDHELPKGCKGVLLGGGYPELYAQQLSENKSMLRSVREAFGSIPMVAECGGFMYLHDTITDKDGNRYPMAGVIHEDCYYTDRLVRFGYVEVNDNGRCFLKNDTSVRGHEFHYYESGLENYDCTAVKPGTDKSYSCIVAGDDHWLGFPHLYYPSNPEFALSFVRKAREAMDRELCKNYYLFGINGWIRGQE